MAKKATKAKAASPKDLNTKAKKSTPPLRTEEDSRARKKASAKKAARSKSSARQTVESAVPWFAIPRTAVVALSGMIPTAEKPYLIERILTPEEVSVEYELRSHELDQKFKEAAAVLNKWLPELKRHPQYESGHITGWSVTFRRRFGHVVSPLQVVIAVNVARKCQKSDLKDESFELPKSVSGIPIKVLEGSFQLMQTAGATATAANDVVPENALPLSSPVIGGIPIGPGSNAADFGTLGIVLQEHGSVIGLTNQHVIRAEDAIRLGPGFVPPGDASTLQKIGTADASRQLIGKKAGLGLFGSVDCAAVKLDATIAVLPNAIREVTHLTQTLSPTNIPLFYADRPIDSRDSSLTILKCGGRLGTPLRGKIVVTQDATVRIGDVDFSQIIYVQHESGNNAFAVGGESGSVLVFRTKISGQPVFILAGLFFGQVKDNSSIGIACHFSDVKSALGLTIAPSLLKRNWDSRPKFD